MNESDTPKFRKPLHYGWIIVFTGVAIIIACLGLVLLRNNLAHKRLAPVGEKIRIKIEPIVRKNPFPGLYS